MTRARMLRSMSAREMTWWQAYHREFPIGEERADLRAGIIAATIVNSNPYRKRGARAARPSDFMPLIKRQPSGLTSPEAQMQWARALAASMGGEVIEAEKT